MYGANSEFPAAALPPRPLLPAVHSGDHLHLGAARGAKLPAVPGDVPHNGAARRRRQKIARLGYFDSFRRASVKVKRFLLSNLRRVYERFNRGSWKMARFSLA